MKEKFKERIEEIKNLINESDSKEEKEIYKRRIEEIENLISFL